MSVPVPVKDKKQPDTKLLSGVLKKDAHDFTQKFTASHKFDRALFRQDIAVSLAHIKMLKSIGLLDSKEYQQLHASLLSMQEDIEKGRMQWRDELEDLHMHIEAGITEKIGAVGRKLHPGRSRNDQVATDIRLYLREETDKIILLILELREILAERAKEYHAVLMPGFTHMQPAQPVTFGHHLLAWQEMLSRDQQRLTDCRKRINRMPLGAAALAGTSFPIDRDLLARELGFDAPMQNSLDAVSARDFALEFASAAAICMQHLSRWSEELILWCSPQFGFVELPASLCTGSSIMPQKKNPDLPELVRGKSGRVFGNLVSLLTLMKGQPLAYNKDNQEDKEPLFDTVGTLSDCLTAWQLLARGLTVHPGRMEASLSMGHINATCLADYLTEKGMPFRDAYTVAGEAVRIAQAEKKQLQELKLEQLQQLSSLIKEDVFVRLDYAKIVASYDLPGGSAPVRVKDAADKALGQIKKNRQETDKR